MQSITFSPFKALNDSTVEPETVLSSAISRNHSEKNVSASPEKPLPRIDPDIIIVDDSDSNSGGSPLKSDSDMFLSKHRPSGDGNTSPVLAATARKATRIPAKITAVTKKYVKKNKSLKVSTSLFQRNPKQAGNEKDTSDVQQQVEHSETSSNGVGRSFMSSAIEEPSASTVKRAPVVMLNDVLPSLSEEQLKQLQSHEKSPDIETNMKSSQENTGALKPKKDSLFRVSTSGVTEALLNSSENAGGLMDKNDTPLDLRTTANVREDGYMIRRSPGQLPKTLFFPRGKKKYINYGAVNNMTNGEENHSVKYKSQVRNDISGLLKNQKHKLNRLRDKERVKRLHSTVTLCDRIISEQSVVSNSNQLLDENATLSEKSVDNIETTMADVAAIKYIPRSSCDIIANEQNMIQPGIALHNKRKKKKKKRHKFENKYVSEHNCDRPKHKRRGRKPGTKNKKKSQVRVSVVDSLSKPVKEHTKCPQSNSSMQSMGLPEFTTSLVTDIMDVHHTGIESIVKSADKIEPWETDLPAFSNSKISSVTTGETTSVTGTKETKSVISTVKVPEGSPPTEFREMAETGNSNTTLRPLLERLSPEKRKYRPSPEKVKANLASQTDVVTVELEKLEDKELQDKAVSQTADKVLKRKRVNTKSSFKESRKTKPPVIKKQKTQKRPNTLEKGSSDVSKLSPSNKGIHQHKLRKRKPVFYAEDEISHNPIPKPPKVPKVSKERRFHHICLKERKDIYEIVIAVEASDQAYSGVPKQYNFLFVKTLNELITAFQMSLQNEKCKAVILSSVGPVFCSGLDPLSLISWSADQPVVQDIIELMTQLVNILIRYSKPVIAIVQGPAVGFGATLLLHCDSVYASDRASLQWPFTQIGLPPFGCTTEILNQTVGLCRTRSLLLEGRIISAQTAKDLGIITEVFRHESLHANAWPLCCALRQQSQSASTQTKQLININFIKSQVECNDCETSHLKRSLKSPYSQKYLQRYVMDRLCPK